MCNKQPERSWKQFFGAQKLFCFWNSSHNTTITGDTLSFHNSGFTQEYQTETPWKAFDWCPTASWQFTRTQVTHIAGCYKEMCRELNHPPYSPDLAPSNYVLIRNLKKMSSRTISRLQCSEGSCNRHFDHQDVSFFSEVFDHWRRSRLSVLQSRGTTVKNNEVRFIIRFNFHVQANNLLNAPRTILTQSV